MPSLSTTPSKEAAMDRFDRTEADILGRMEKATPTLYERISAKAKDGDMVRAEIAQICLDENVRQIDTGTERFKAFVESIKETGMLQPPVITIMDGRVVCVAGHRRIFAAKELGHDTVRCVFRLWQDEEGKDIATLVENIQRESLAPLDLARAISKLVSRKDSIQKAAEILGRNRKYVERLRIIDSWNEEAKTLIRNHPTKFPLKTLYGIASRGRANSEVVAALKEVMTGTASSSKTYRSKPLEEQELTQYFLQKKLPSRDQELVTSVLKEFGLIRRASR
jgi:ParB/RepB/Spo0J family partition protein